MDFYSSEARARQQTRQLLVLFSLAVLINLMVTYCALAAIFLSLSKPVPGMTRVHSPLLTPFLLFSALIYQPGQLLSWLWSPQLAQWVALGSLASVAGGCLYKTRQLSRGGSVVAETLGGTQISPGTGDASQKRLCNVVEEMAIASELPVPAIYVLENERGINAFAAGHSRDDVALGVTRGAVELLNRDQLQGVIAHEFSHILNGDTRFNMRLMGVVHGLLWPSLAGRALTYGRSEPLHSSESLLDRDSRIDLQPTAPIGLILIVLGYFALPSVRLIKRAICRQREWMADAAAVRFTRNPSGIAEALRRIGGLAKQGRLDHPAKEVASHLYFANAHPDPWLGFLSTHPPLADRIRAIDPSFDGIFPRVTMLRPNQQERDEAFARAMAATMEFDQASEEESAGTVDSLFNPERIRRATLMRMNLPDHLKAALHEPEGAAAVLYALLLSEEEEARARQMEILQRNLRPALYDRTASLATAIQEVDGTSKLALAEFAMPALQKACAQGQDPLESTIQEMIECDGAVDLREYALMKMITRKLGHSMGPPRRQSPIFRHPAEVRSECALILSALGHLGSLDESEAQQAFARGLEFLDMPGEPLAFRPRHTWTLLEVDEALGRLERCTPTMQRNILLACGKVVVNDGRVGDREEAMLRAIAVTFGCPLPPFVEAILGEARAEG